MNLNKSNLEQYKEMVRITKRGTHTAKVQRNINTIVYNFKSADGKSGNQIVGTITDILAKVDSRGWKPVEQEIAITEEEPTIPEIEPTVEELISSADLAKEFKITPQDLRRQLRKARIEKPEIGWRWQLGSEELEEVRNLLSGVQEKRRTRAK